MDIREGEDEMRCPECNATQREYNESLGETCCVSCGLVLSWNPIEEFSVISTAKEDTITKTLATQRLLSNGSNAFVTNDGLGSTIIPSDSKSRRLAYTQLRASSSYRGGLSSTDKHMIVLVKNHLHQYGMNSFDNAKKYLDATISLKKRLTEMNKLRGYSVEVRASVLLYLILKQDNLTSLTRHSKITGISKKKLSKLGRMFARHMATPQIFSAITNTKMMGDHLDLLQSNGIVIDPELRGDCYILSDFVAKELDDRDLPYKNSTNATVIWMVSQIREAGLLQRDICSVNNTTEQTIRGALRNVLYPTLDFDKQCLSELTVEDLVSGIRTEAYRQRKKGEKE